MNPQPPSLPLIKVCGLTRIQDAQHALASGANAIGAVHVPNTPRFVTIEQAATLFASASSQAKVLVVYNAASTDVAQWAQAANASHVQLCGEEVPQDWRDFPLPILRRIGVDIQGQQELEAWADLASLFVLDHPSSPGGSGKTVDFALARALASRAPCLLAGGLGPDNVANAIAQVSPLGVDASSGLEATRGIKDPQKVTSYIEQSRQALQSPRAERKAP